jgi:L-cysteine desulfidase
MDYAKVIDILKEDMRPALGVTDPVAISLACAKAYEAIGGELNLISVEADPGIFKNGFFCAIPGTTEFGNEIAAILGVIAGDSLLKLEVLKNISKSDIKKAAELRDKGFASVKVKKGMTEVYIDAVVHTDRGTGRAVIENIHDNIVLVEKNGNTVYEKKPQRGEGMGVDRTYINKFSIKDFKKFVDEVPFEKIRFTLEAIRMNSALASEGMSKKGMGAGTAISELIRKGILKEDIRSHAQRLTAYAVDARMGGVPLPAMSIAGSGDHGIVTTMPLLAVKEKINASEEKLARAIALSYLVTIYIKNYAGLLSAFCGCSVAAGTGASAGIVYMFGGDHEKIGHAIHNMAANITGIICDGGNYGCALKAVTGVGAAVTSALFAMNGFIIPYGSGIVGYSPEESLRNMGRIASPGMLCTDEEILTIMEERAYTKR